MLRLKSRASCQCFTNNTTSCATNVTIAQPRNAPPKPNRTKAYKDKGPDDDTVVQTFVPNANSVQNNYYEHNMSNRTLLNGFNILKASGNISIYTKYGAPFSFYPGTVQSTLWDPTASPIDNTYAEWIFWGRTIWSNVAYGGMGNLKIPMTDRLLSKDSIGDFGYQRGASWNESFFIRFNPGTAPWTPPPTLNSISTVSLWDENGNKVREYSTAGADAGQFSTTAVTDYYWWWPASDNNWSPSQQATNSPYTMAQEHAFWSSMVGKKLAISWNGLPTQTGFETKINSVLYSRKGKPLTIGTSNNNTNNRLLRLKSNAMRKSI